MAKNRVLLWSSVKKNVGAPRAEARFLESRAPGSPPVRGLLFV